jgi:four helix bundle protein
MPLKGDDRRARCAMMNATRGVRVNRIRDYKDLIVRQRAMELAETCHDIVALLPYGAKRDLASQIRRAANSITANIAEGHSRPSRHEYLNYIGIARASLKELESHLLTLQRIGRAKGARLVHALDLADECSRMLTVLRRRLSEPRSRDARPSRPPPRPSTLNPHPSPLAPPPGRGQPDALSTPPAGTPHNP